LPSVFAALLLSAPAEAAPQWFAPGTLSDTSKDSFNPDVAVDSSGRAVAVWTSEGTIVSVYRQTGQAWGPRQTVSGVNVGGYQPKVALDPNGNAVAVWTEGVSINTKVMASTRPSGGSWTSPVTIGSNGTDPQVSVDPQGNAVAVWRGSGDDIRSAFRPAGGSFSNAQKISEPTAQAYEPAVAAEPNGEAVAVWTRFPGIQQVQFARRRNFTPYASPIGASPMRVSLVPSYVPCETGSANSRHGTPLNFLSCNPPARSSTTVAAGPRSLGFVRLIVCDVNSAGAICAPLTKPDVKLTGSITDVRNGSPTGTDYDDPDGQPDLTEQLVVKITDMYNTDGPSTVVNQPFQVPIDCVTTTDTTIGSACSVNTTENALVPGLVLNGKAAVWETKQIQVFDQGADAIRGNADDKVFEAQGVFTP